MTNIVSSELNDRLYGKYYKIKDTVKLRVSENKLKYCGTQKYKDETKYNFFDTKTRLLHWLIPSEVEAI